MKRSILILSTVFAFFGFSFGTSYITTEVLDEAQNSLKIAYESKCHEYSPYEYSKAKAYYEISKIETSKGNLDAGRAAALKSIEWALKAISKRFGEGH